MAAATRRQLADLVAWVRDLDRRIAKVQQAAVIESKTSLVERFGVGPVSLAFRG